MIDGQFMPRLGPAYLEETSALLARFTTPATVKRALLINTFIGDLIDAGVWSKLDFLHVMAGATEQAAQRNWIADAYNLTPSGSPTFTADRGYTGNGSSSYVGTGATASALTNYQQTDASFGAWALTAGSANTALMGTQPSGFIIRLASNQSGSERLVRLNVSTSFSTDDDETTGFVTATRIADGTVTTYRNGGDAASTSLGSNPPSAEEFTYLRSAGGYSNQQIALGFAGASLTSGEVSDFYDAALAYLQGVGAVA